MPPARTTETSEEPLAGLFDRHQERLYRLALRMCSDAETARDPVQETFLRAARRRRLPAGEPGGAGPAIDSTPCPVPSS